MGRHDFIKTSLAGGLVWDFGRRPLFASDDLCWTEREIMQRLRPWDAHAHPYRFFSDRSDATTPIIAMIRELGLAVCVFSAGGDRVYNVRGGARGESPKFDTARQLDRVTGWAKEGEIRRIKKATDLDQLQTGQLGAIVGIEGEAEMVLILFGAVSIASGLRAVRKRSVYLDGELDIRQNIRPGPSWP